LRYAFRRRGAGLGDRTPSPGPARFPSRSPESLLIDGSGEATNIFPPNDRIVTTKDFHSWEDDEVRLKPKLGTAEIEGDYRESAPDHSTHNHEIKRRSSSRTRVPEPPDRGYSSTISPSLNAFRPWDNSPDTTSRREMYSSQPPPPPLLLPRGIHEYRRNYSLNLILPREHERYSNQLPQDIRESMLDYSSNPSAILVRERVVYSSPPPPPPRGNSRFMQEFLHQTRPDTFQSTGPPNTKQTGLA
jgi:hypothetical protein